MQLCARNWHYPQMEHTQHTHRMRHTQHTHNSEQRTPPDNSPRGHGPEMQVKRLSYEPAPRRTLLRPSRDKINLKNVLVLFARDIVAKRPLQCWLVILFLFSGSRGPINIGGATGNNHLRWNCCRTEVSS